MMNSVLENFTILQVKSRIHLYSLFSRCLFAGDHQQGHPGDAALHGLRVRGVHFRARRPASHLQIGEGLRREFELQYKELFLVCLATFNMYKPL